MNPKQPQRRTLNVAITGHRPNRMPERHWERVRSDLNGTFAKLEEQHPGRRLVLMSGLAEGADRLAAFVALGRGWKLRATLAFHRSRFEEDFPNAAAVGEFRSLLKAADKIDEPQRGAHLGLAAEDGYDSVARSLLSRADVVVAVWDGADSRGKGGTVEVIEAARKAGIPVVWISATKPHKPKWLGARPKHPRGERRRRMAEHQ